MYDAQLQCLAVARLQARKSEGGERAALQSASHRDAEADVGRTDEVQRNGTHARKNRLRGDQGGGGGETRRAGTQSSGIDPRLLRSVRGGHRDTD